MRAKSLQQLCIVRRMAGGGQHLRADGVAQPREFLQRLRAGLQPQLASSRASMSRSRSSCDA